MNQRPEVSRQEAGERKAIPATSKKAIKCPQGAWWLFICAAGIEG